MVRTSSLNCLSCRNPYHAPHSLNCLPPLFSLHSECLSPFNLATHEINRGPFRNAPINFASVFRKWPRSLFRPVQARSWKELLGAGWDQDGPGWPPPRDLDGSEMLENKAHGESGRDPFGPGMGTGQPGDRTQASVWMAPPEGEGRGRVTQICLC